MNGAFDAVPAWVALPVSLLLLLGGAVILIGALGLLRLPTFYQRIHGPAITITLGAGCVLIASMAYFTWAQSRPAVHELLITAFVFLTAPVVSMLVMRAAVHRDVLAGRLTVFEDHPAEGAGNAANDPPDTPEPPADPT